MEAYWTIVALLIGCSALVYGVPAIDPAAVAADPVAVAAPPAPVVVAEKVPVATSPVRPVVAEEQLGGGTVTEHKNPDGSTVTITRYNGPLPENAFKTFGNIGTGLGLGGFAGLHDSLFQRNLYQNQLIQLQTQQAINQAYLGHYNIFNNLYNYNPLSVYRTSYISPYTTSYSSIGHGPAFYPSFFPYGIYNPLFPSYGQPAARTV